MFQSLIQGTSPRFFLFCDFTATKYVILYLLSFSSLTKKHKKTIPDNFQMSYVLSYCSIPVSLVKLTYKAIGLQIAIHTMHTDVFRNLSSTIWLVSRQRPMIPHQRPNKALHLMYRFTTPPPPHRPLLAHHFMSTNPPSGQKPKHRRGQLFSISHHISM